MILGFLFGQTKTFEDATLHCDGLGAFFLLFPRVNVKLRKVDLCDVLLRWTKTNMEAKLIPRSGEQ